MTVAALLLAFALQEKPIELFNGKDLTGWVAMNKAEWSVEDGCLSLTGKGGNGWLRSEKMYKDFELSLEWKTTAAEKYDSGVYIRALEKGNPFPRVGIQINLLKDQEGAGVGMKDAPGRPDLLKKGDWNAWVIRVEGKKVKLTFNGKEAWTAEHAGPEEGYVGLQAEGVPFLFRSIKITPLKSE